jgi:phosphonate transport system substrate-binding protein
MMKQQKQINILHAGLMAIMLLILLAAPVEKISAEEKSSLILGVHPYLPPAELEKRFAPLIHYLSRQLGVPMELSISKDYETHLENIGNKIFDIAYIGPSSYVELINKYGSHTLLARLEIAGKPYFNGYIVVKQDSNIQSIEELKGKRFAFGSPHSTMSYLVPRHMMREAGVSLESLREYKFQGNHRNVALGVLLGEFDAGAIKEETYFKFKEKGLRSIAISPSISEHVFVCRSRMFLQKYNKLQDSMYQLSKTNEGRSILMSIKKGVSGLVPVIDKDYDNLRSIMRKQ